MISVIVPVYKVEKYLKRCVASIQDQTYKNLEIILIDDGSPDECGKMCDEFAEKDTRIKVVHQKNGGLAKARNKGLEIAKGEYITFVDSDDMLEAQMMEMLLLMIKEDADIDISICGHRIVYEDKERVSPKDEECKDNVILNQQELWEEIFGQLNNAVWNKMYKRSVIGELRFPEGIIHGEDLIFNLNYLRKCNKGIINQTVGYNYLKRQNSITSSMFSKNKLYEIEAKDIALKIVEEYMPEQLENARKYCFRARMNVLRSIYKAKKNKVYFQEVSSYLRYVKENYSVVKSLLKSKEKIEFWLLIRFKPFYKIIISKM